MGTTYVWQYWHHPRIIPMVCFPWEAIKENLRVNVGQISQSWRAGSGADQCWEKFNQTKTKVWRISPQLKGAPISPKFAPKFPQNLGEILGFFLAKICMFMHSCLIYTIYMVTLIGGLNMGHVNCFLWTWKGGLGWDLFCLKSLLGLQDYKHPASEDIITHKKRNLGWIDDQVN